MTRMGQFAAVIAAFALAAPVSAQSARSARQTSAESRGYRLRGYQWDPILAQRWAVLEDAVHPERPLVAELAPSDIRVAGLTSSAPPAAVSTPAAVFTPTKVAALAVRSGDPVTLWSEDKNVRMQISAVAEGNASIGERIQLRVTGAGVNGNTGWRVAGIVRGPGSVEIE